jgi:large conductance mechanosensitive channel
MAGGFKNMFEGFKQFIMRGNVVELAVAVAIGAAFTAVVKSFTDFIINPLVAVFGGINAAGLGFRIDPDNAKTFVDIGAVITAILQFLITAAVIYFIIVAPMKKANDRLKARKPEPEPLLPPEPDIALLEEIRDLLKSGLGAVAQESRPDDGEPGDAPVPPKS